MGVLNHCIAEGWRHTPPPHSKYRPQGYILNCMCIAQFLKVSSFFKNETDNFNSLGAREVEKLKLKLKGQKKKNLSKFQRVTHIFTCIFQLSRTFQKYNF